MADYLDLKSSTNTKRPHGPVTMHPLTKYHFLRHVACIMFNLKSLQRICLSLPLSLNNSVVLKVPMAGLELIMLIVVVASDRMMN